MNNEERENTPVFLGRSEEAQQQQLRIVTYYCVTKLETPTPLLLKAVLSVISKRLLLERISSPNALYGRTNEP